MTTLEIVKAWKDEDYRESLTDQERAQLPEHPSGTILLQESELRDDGLFAHKSTWHGHCSYLCSCGCSGGKTF